jgi:hypothetical protein
MGSSGMKRKGRRHQPKVGTRPERDYALHQEQHAVVENFGVSSSKGWMFWVAVVLIVTVAAIGLFSWILFF